jgi:hypothetical protein
MAETTVSTGFDALVKRRDKCITVGGEYVVFFHVRISHVLRCVSVCDLLTGSPSYFEAD